MPETQQPIIVIIYFSYYLIFHSSVNLQCILSTCTCSCWSVELKHMFYQSYICRNGPILFLFYLVPLKTCFLSYSLCTCTCTFTCTCTVHVQYMYCICDNNVQYTCSTCTVHVQYMYSTYTVHVLYMYSTCTVHVQCM